VGGGFDEGTSPDDPLQGDTVRALKVSSPLVATSNNSHVHLSLNQSELAATSAIAALQTEVAGKQDVLGFVPDEDPNSFQILQGGVIRALKVSSPLVATSDMSQVHVSLDPGWSPFWVCGIFDGNDLAKLADTGRHPFTVTRPSGSTVGIFRVSWSTPHPQGVNYITHVTAEFGVAMIRRRTDGPNTSTGFDCFCRDPGSMATNVNRIIHFSVVT
jgi:hypothetical protein